MTSFSFDRPVAPDPYPQLPAVPTFTVESSDLTASAPMPTAHTDAGGSHSPQLSWHGFPEGTRSFVVSCFDPDAPTPAGFWHWTVVDLPATATTLPTGAGCASGERLPPPAFQTRNDGGGSGYTGAAPPAGDRSHRYVFAVHALDIDHLGVNPDTSATAVAFTALFHTLARGTLTATFQQ